MCLGRCPCHCVWWCLPGCRSVLDGVLWWCAGPLLLGVFPLVILFSDISSAKQISRILLSPEPLNFFTKAVWLDWLQYLLHYLCWFFLTKIIHISKLFFTTSSYPERYVMVTLRLILHFKSLLRFILIVLIKENGSIGLIRQISISIS